MPNTENSWVKKVKKGCLEDEMPSWEDFVSSWECSCGSSFCRKRVTGKDWRILELQERYKGHFLPFINKRHFTVNHDQKFKKT